MRIKHITTHQSIFIISHEYKRTIILLLIAIAACSGIIFPEIPYPNAPRVDRTIFRQPQPKESSLRESNSVSSNFISQVSQLSIGQQKITPTPTSLPVTSNKQWGVATQLDEHTWTMNLEKDEKMSTADEILTALNSYRQRQGKQTLSWDSTLAAYAQSRADNYASAGNTDKHAGFLDYINHQDGFKKLGFNALGENSSFGYILLGVHLIEWVYAGDKPHDDNQLSSSWSHVGIGVKGTATDLIFGGNKQ